MADVQAPGLALASSPRIGAPASADSGAMGPAAGNPIPVTVQLIPPYPPAPGVHWTAYVTAVPMAMVAVLVTGIAYRLWDTTRHGLNLALHDRRVALYDRLNALGSNVHNGAWKDAPTDHYDAFLELVREMKWVFSARTMHFVTGELGEQLKEYSIASEADLGNVDADQKEVLRRRKAAVLVWLGEQGKRTTEVFTQDLRLTR